MKIAFISTLYPPDIMGGAEIVVEKIVNELSKRDHDVFVITTGKEDKVENKDGIKIYRLNFNLYFLPDFNSQNILKRLLWQLFDLLNFKAYINIRKILKKEGACLVHIHNYKGLSPLAFKAAKDLKIPLIFTAHDYSPICVRSNLLNGNGEICYRKNPACKLYNAIQSTIIGDKVDVITAPSKFVLDKLESEGLFRNAKKIVVPNPIEYTPKRYKKTYDTIDILFVGSLSKHKGPDILIKSFKKVEGDNLRLHIAGRGPMEGELRKLAEDDDRINFYGFVTGDELQNLYRMANVTVVPSIWYDNSPMVIYESFANSTPLIASRIGGIPELVNDGYNGFLFEAGNFKELERLINKIVEDPSILEVLENGAYESCKKYQLEVILEALISIYKQLRIDDS